MLCDALDGRGVWGELIHMYVWLSHFLFTLNYDNIVNRLYPITKFKKMF